MELRGTKTSCLHVCVILRGQLDWAQERHKKQSGLAQTALKVSLIMCHSALYLCPCPLH
jgi:undecaprenyl pyrophosphate synthase